MTGREFIKERPDLVKKAKKCESFGEFVDIARENNIKFDDISLEQAYNYVCGRPQELEEDSLESVAGGGKIQNKLEERVQESINPSKKTGKVVVISQSEAETLLGSGTGNIFLDDTDGKWYRLK